MARRDQLSQIGQALRQSGVADDGQLLPGGPNDQCCAAVTAIKRDPFIASGLMKLQFCIVHITQGTEWANFIFVEFKRAQTGILASRRAPFGQVGASVNDLADFEAVFGIRRATLTTAWLVVSIFRAATFRYGQQGQMQFAFSLPGGGQKQRRNGGISAFQLVKPKLGRRVGMLKRIDQLFRHLRRSGRQLAPPSSVAMIIPSWPTAQPCCASRNHTAVSITETGTGAWIQRCPESSEYST